MRKIQYDEGSVQAKAEWLASFPELNPNPVIEVDTGGTIHYVNPAADRLFPDLRKSGAAHPWLAYLSTAVARFRRGETCPVSCAVEVDQRHYHQSLHLVRRTERIRIFGFDITDRQRLERTLQATLAEKELLLRELGHRTKNNMQVICGLMSLQAATVADKNLLDVLSDTQDRIRAMALVHEKLHRSGNFASLSFKDYSEDLLKAVLGAHHATGGRVRTETDLEDLSVSIDFALPLGLIINELVSNSLKHAFPGTKSGTIFLSFRRHGKLTETRYRDDGPGLPRDFDLSQVRSLGLQLVHNLATLQLRGTMEIRHGPDTEFVFTFGDLTHMAVA